MRVFRFLSLLFLLAAAAIVALAADVSFAWDPSTSDDITGYKMYVGLASRTYGAPIVLGNQTTCTVTGFGPGTYFFAVTAFNVDGRESDFSNEVSMLFPEAPDGRCDLNGDAAVNALDIQLLINKILSGQPTIGDVNVDSKVDVLDLQILSNVVLGRRLCPGQ